MGFNHDGFQKTTVLQNNRILIELLWNYKDMGLRLND